MSSDLAASGLPAGKRPLGVVVLSMVTAFFGVWSAQALGAVCNEFYGLTEVNHLAGSCARLWPGKAGSMGRP